MRSLNLSRWRSSTRSCTLTNDSNTVVTARAWIWIGLYRTYGPVWWKFGSDRGVHSEQTLWFASRHPSDPRAWSQDKNRRWEETQYVRGRLGRDDNVVWFVISKQALRRHTLFTQLVTNWFIMMNLRNFVHWFLYIICTIDVIILKCLII